VRSALKALGGGRAAAAGGGIAGAAAIAVTPTMANDPAYSEVREGQWFPDYGEISRSIEQINVRNDGRGAEVYVRPGRSSFAPVGVRVPSSLGRAQNPDALPDMDRVPPMPLPHVRPWSPSNPWDDEYAGLYDDPYAGLDVRGGVVDDKARNVLPNDLPSLPLPDVPPWQVAKPIHGGMSKVITISQVDGMVRWRAMTRQVAAAQSPAWRDTKYGRRLVMQMYGLVTHTYGAVSELNDAVEQMAWNMYGRTADGRIVKAMNLEGRSMLATFQGYLEGDYRLDTVGFVEDYTWMQASDRLYAATSQVQLAIANRFGGRFGWSANTAVNQIANAERDRAIKERRELYRNGQDYLAEHRRFDDVRSNWVRTASDEFSSWSERSLSAVGLSREGRVQSLWR
jgi:hypothetical protein